MNNWNALNFGKRMFVVLFGIMMLTACGKEDPLTVNQQAFKLLAGTWELGTIELDGIDQTANYPGFALTFTGTGYTATAGGDLLGAGTWVWATETGKDISLVEGKDITLVNLTATSLVFTFTLNRVGGVANGINGINGNYRVSLLK